MKFSTLSSLFIALGGFSSARLGFAGEEPRVLSAGLPGLLRYGQGVDFDQKDLQAVFQELCAQDGARPSTFRCFKNE